VERRSEIVADRPFIHRHQLVPARLECHSGNEFHIKEELGAVAFPCIDFWYWHLVLHVTLDQPHTLSFSDAVSNSILDDEVNVRVEDWARTVARDAFR
jgi:hypothetical protein